MLELTQVCKHFTLHHQQGALLPVLDNVNLRLAPGECVVLDGPSGMGKSTLLKLIYGNYRVSSGQIRVRDPQGALLDLTQATPREVAQMRRHRMGYVSQFLRVIPRVPAVDVVAEPLMDDAGQDQAAIERAREMACALLERLRIPQRLWRLPPATFSGGEQQRINIARSFIKPRPLLLLDEPSASLDAANTRTVIELMNEARDAGAALIGIFHDHEVGEAVATRRIDVAQFRSKP